MKLRLIQPSGGRPVGADLASEAEVIAELSDNFAHYTLGRLLRLREEEIFIWGSYRLRSIDGYLLPKTHYIGRKDPGRGGHFKLWGYAPRSATLSFLTLSTGHVTGGGNAAPDEVEKELELNNVWITSGRVKSSGDGTRNGFVRYANDHNSPFHTGNIFWEPK